MERPPPGADAHDPSDHSLPAYLSAIASESSNTSYPYLETLDDGQELHIGRPGSLYRIVSADEMASREREHSTAVAAPPPPAAKPAETIIRGSAFRRGIADCEERQIPGPRRFGFGTSPPRRGNDSRSSAPPSMIYDRPPSPRASSSNYSDTPRQTTILPPSSSAARALLLDASSPPLGRRMSVPTVRPSNDVRNIGTRTDVIIEDRQQPLPQSQQPTHPVFSQLALVLGFELAKRVTERHPHELDLNRLANLALDITAAPAAAAAVSEPAAPATPAASATPARSVSTTSAASAASTASLELQQRRRGNRSSFSRGGGNRSPQSDTTTTRRFGGGRVTSPLDRSARDTQRANSTPNDTADDTFVTAVSAATATVPPPLLPSPLPSLMDVPVEDATADASRASVAVEAVDVAVVYDLIDWEGEAASQEAVHPVSSAPLLVESSHLLD